MFGSFAPLVILLEKLGKDLSPLPILLLEKKSADSFELILKWLVARYFGAQKEALEQSRLASAVSLRVAPKQEKRPH
jgi:hypothetical protein